ncbi:uncharacterized protein KQ657_004955 [Scheffersomyces spartinae]|uniref:Calponin-homology (CH) domain-containing protein n=1 Tax=Scheffersomyces spartinae TaxID=45513 RepID=A0A9P8AIZ1_9ASCO|nr:uncharacterized protein KQ657_004955 [Scheffersomyces spartinae]KAG7194236.1 hypothetical protein KQ657_004955 [Scheffersomyces spartinae]
MIGTTNTASATTTNTSTTSGNSDWIASQKKTLLRWVNSKSPSPVKDLVTDLRNGLVLVELVTQIPIAGTTFVLLPIHKNPTFKLQMVENIQDLLDYCRLILKINTTGISADAIVNGNEKLVLGLVWLLFINSSALTISQLSDHGGFVELKGIIVNWVQNIAAKKNIIISDLSKDWSLARDCRPDLILFEIQEHYCPGKLSLCDNPVQNLANIITFAETYLGIARLVDVETFMDLIPDDKCVLTYLVEWYIVMETKMGVGQLEEEKVEAPLDPMIEFLIQTIRLKNTYETKALRYINKINSLLPRIARNLEYLSSLKADNFSVFIRDSKCDDNDGDEVDDDTERIISLTAPLDDFMGVTEGYVLYLDGTLNALLATDYSELQSLIGHINNNLQKCGLTYDPPKFYTPLYLEGKYLLLKQQGNQLHRKISDSIITLQRSLTKGDLYSLVEKIEQAFSRNDLDPDLKEHYIKILSSVEHATGVLKKLDVICGIVNSKSQIFDTIQSKDELITHYNTTTATTTTTNKDLGVSESTYKLFREKFLQGNHFTEQELLNWLHRNADENLDAILLKQLLRLVPSKSLEKHMDSDFLLSDGSDHDSDGGHSSSSSLFDGIQKKIETKLFGFDKVYDTEEFLMRVDNGFRV